MSSLKRIKLQMFALIQHFLESCLRLKYCVFECSSFCPVSGVSQGSNLGPVLLSVFKNDLLHALQINVVNGCTALLTLLFNFELFDDVECVADFCLLNTFFLWYDSNRFLMKIGKLQIVPFRRNFNSRSYPSTIDSSALLLIKNSPFSDVLASFAQQRNFMCLFTVIVEILFMFVPCLPFSVFCQILLQHGSLV